MRDVELQWTRGSYSERRAAESGRHPTKRVGLRQLAGLFGTALDMPLALFLLSALAGLWVAYDRASGWRALTAILSSVAAYYAVVCATRFGMQVWTLGLVGILVSVALAVFFVTQAGHLEYPHKLRPVSAMRDLSRVFPRYTPFRPHPNSVAAYLEGWLPLGVAMTLDAKRRWVTVAMAVCTATLALAIFLTASRGAWLALALCLPLWWATRCRRNSAVITAGVGAGMLALVAYGLLRPEAFSDSGSLMYRAVAPLLVRPGRLEVYRGSWYLIQDFPFTGIGLGETFAMVYSRYVLMIQVPFLTYSHNLFLQVWLNQGLMGIFAFGWLIAGFFLFVWKAAPQGDALLDGAWLGVAAILLHGLSDARQYADGWTLVSLFALMGLTVAAGGGRRSLREGGRRMQRVGGLAVVGVLVTLLVFAWRPLTAMGYANTGALSQARGELGQELTDEQRRILVTRAARLYGQAVVMDQANRTAHQRMGVLAMDAGRLDEALAHLETAHRADPANTTTHKALGLAYTWAGHLHHAEQMLADIPDIVEELNVWGWWWGTQGERAWAANAYRMSLQLRPAQPAIREALAAVEWFSEEGAGSSQ